MMDTNKRQIIKGAELTDNPGWYQIEGRIEGESDTWAVIRKPDGSWWPVTHSDIFPRGGGNYSVKLGDRITDQKTLTVCEQHYDELRHKSKEESKA